MPRKTYRKRRRRLRAKAVVALCAIIIGLTLISTFSLSHFFVKANAVPASKSVSNKMSSSNPSKTASVVSSAAGTSSSTVNKVAVSASSAAVSSASVVKPVQVSLQNAVKPLRIHVSIEDQTVTVYDANNQIVESWLCSTGSPGYDTPRGTFSVYYRCKYFWSSTYQEGAEYAVEFVQHYYLHSVPLDKNNNIIPSIADDLGHEDSHGCVHLAMSNSEWIYDNIPNGTKVVVD